MMEPIFVNCFWGERHQGFDVLQHNLKSASKATMDMIDFLRDSCSLQDYYQKTLNKLARQAGAISNAGSFTPCWGSVKQLLERQSATHLELHQFFISLMKDVQRYSEEQTRRHKELKDGEAATQEVVTSFQTSSQQLQKAKDFYHSRYLDLQKLRRSDNPSTRELEKNEGRLKKAQNDYRYMIERYNNSRNTFVDKMRASCSHFQEVEHNHLEQMREFLVRFGNGLTSQLKEEAVALQDYEKSINIDRSVFHLLNQFAAEKGTGTIEPAMALFEDGEIANSTTSINTIGSGSNRSSSRQTNDGNAGLSSSFAGDRLGASSRKENIPDFGDHRQSGRSVTSQSNSTNGNSVQLDPTAVQTSTKRWDTGNFFRKKGRKKDTPSSSGGGETSRPSTGDWRSETPVELPVDDEGYSQPPPNAWTRSDVDDKTAASSDSSSDDSDDMNNKPFKNVVIRPVSVIEQPDRKSPSLNQSIPLPPAPLGGGRISKGRVTPQIRGNVAAVKNSSALDSPPGPSGRRKSVTDPWGFPCNDSVDAAGGEKDDISFELIGSDVAKPPSELPVSSKKRHASVDSILDPFSTPIQSPEENRPSFLTTAFSVPNESQFASSQPTNDDGSVCINASSESFLVLEDKRRRSIPTNSAPAPPAVVPILPPRPKTKITDPWGGDVKDNNKGSPRKNASESGGTILKAVPELGILDFPLSQNSASTPPIPPPVSSLPPRDKAFGGNNRPLPPPPPTSIPPVSLSPNIILSRDLSRGPSPLPGPLLDNIPVAVAVTEIYHARFHGIEGNILHRKVNGELNIAFSSGVIRRLIDMQSLAPLEFRIEDSKSQIRNLNWDARYFQECRDDGNKGMHFLMNMSNLREWIRLKREQEPDGKYISVDLLKYEVNLLPDNDPPVHIKSYWQAENDHILHLRVDFQFPLKEFPPVNLNIRCDLPIASSTASPASSAPITTEKRDLLSYFEPIQSHPNCSLVQQNRAEWIMPMSSMSQGSGSLCAKFELKHSEELPQDLALTPKPVQVTFAFSHRQLSDTLFELGNNHYHLSLYKKRLLAGLYVTEPHGDREFV